MPIPTYLDNFVDGLPDIPADGGVNSGLPLMDQLVRLGWIEAERGDDGAGAEYRIFNNVPLHDAPIYIRADFDPLVVDPVAEDLLDNTAAFSIELFASLEDAQSRTSALQQSLVSHKVFNGATDTLKNSYALIGDSRSAYLFHNPQSNQSSTTFPEYTQRFYNYLFMGELPRIGAAPAFSMMAGGNLIFNGNHSFASGVNGSLNYGAITNSIDSGPGATPASLFGAGSCGNLGAALGSNDDADLIMSPVYIYETGSGKLRGLFPGLSVPALGISSISNGIDADQAFSSYLGPTIGARVPVKETKQSTAPDGFIYLDLTNDWDSYHAP